MPIFLSIPPCVPPTSYAAAGVYLSQMFNTGSERAIILHRDRTKGPKSVTSNKAERLLAREVVLSVESDCATSEIGRFGWVGFAGGHLRDT